MLHINTRQLYTISKHILQQKKCDLKKKDKARGVVILYRIKHIEKCMALLNIERFKRYCSYREKNTKNFENNKIQVLRAGIQKIIPKSFRTNSILRDSQDTQVIKSDRAIDELPIQSIIFSINTASCQLPNTLLKVPVRSIFI